jgi:hypothetical protein
MDYSSMIKKLRLPPGFLAPTRLTYEDLLARAITRADLHDDVRGINASIALIQTTRGGGWPTEPVTEEINFVDLVWVTPDAYEDGYYQQLYRALRHWLAEEFAFGAPYYSNAVIPRD